MGEESLDEVTSRNPEKVGAGVWLRRERSGVQGHRGNRTGNRVEPWRTATARQRD